VQENLILRDLAIKSVVEACTFLETINFGYTTVEKKSSESDLVTEIDRRIEKVIVDFLRGERGSDSFLGEEGSTVTGSSEIKWVIDPIDGTTNFVYGIPGFGVSVAAEKNGEIIAGAVADPVHNEIYDAAKGFGSRCNGNKINVRRGNKIESALIATGFSYSTERREVQSKILTQLLPKIGDIRRFGAAAVDLCWVANGRVDAFYEEGLNYWDYAAGSLIALEAGATVQQLPDFLGETLLVAVSPEIEMDFLAFLERACNQIVEDS
jgi:myo-inositol-1(or 4)-monophosphatase